MSYVINIKTIFIVNLMIVLLFAIIYMIVGSYKNNFNHAKKTLNFRDALYFSLTTQTKIGYGEITPRSSLAKWLVMLQQLIVLFNLPILKGLTLSEVVSMFSISGMFNNSPQIKYESDKMNNFITSFKSR